MAQSAPGLRGFTLIELVVVLVLLGILSVYAVPRMMGSSSVTASGFHNAVLSYLRYAQKTAVAQRRAVCVNFPAVSQVQLAIASAAPDTAASYTCDAPLTGPGGETPARLSAGNAGVFSSLPSSFEFDAQGQPVSAAGGAFVTAIAIPITGTSLIYVEATTGYVHD